MAGTWPVGAVAPGFTLPKSSKARTNRAEFGDGYSQRGKKGINNIKREWSLSWEGLTKTEKETIENFLITQGGLSFNWTPPGEVTTRLVSCDEWKEDFEGYDVYKFSASFEEEIL